MTLSYRYDIDDEELIRLQLLAQRRIGGSSRASSVNSSLVNYRRVTSNGVRPGFLSSVGETATPLTPSAAQLATPLTPSAAQLATPLTPSAAQLASPLTPSAAQLATPLTPSAAQFATPLTPSAAQLAKPLTPSAAQLASPLTPSAAQLATPLTPSAAQLATPLTPSAAVLAEKRKNILERRQQLEDGRLRRKELRKKGKNAQKIRLEERMKFEKEMEERYRPKIPEKKSLIFLADQEDMKATVKERILLKYFTNDDDSEESVKPLVNDEQRAVFANIFDEIDLNRDGWIDMKEFKGKLCSMATKDQLKQLLQVFDVNRDSFVDKREFVVICALNDKLRGSRTESGTTSLELNIQRLANFLIIYKELFDIIDEDGDGKVQVDEVVLLVKTAVQADNSLCEEKIMMELGIMEKDEKGCIDFITFIYNVSLFSRLFRVVMDSPLSVSNLEDVRDRVLRKHSRKASGNT
ncbi:uncharacterized protein LOC124437392 isoform X2 [Xenia sp. Carnegie-2017]|nr:uncharacterized protein LOC124437392 isoform X2 [Xenia sp. Carnegie-2017]